MTLIELRDLYLSNKISALKAARMCKHHRDELEKLYPGPMSTIAKFYLYTHNHPISVAQCEKSTKSKRFNSLSNGFRKYCGNYNDCECNRIAATDFWENMNPETQQKINEIRKNTVRQKYGVDSVSQITESKIKAEKTCLARYGTKSPTQNKEILKKSSETCKNNWGVDWPQQNEQIYSKTTQTFNTKWNVNRPAQHPIFQNRMRETMICRWGVDNPMKLPSVKKQIDAQWRLSTWDEMIGLRGGLTPLFSRDDYSRVSGGDLLLWHCDACGSEFHETVQRTLGGKCPLCVPKHMTWGEAVISSWLNELGCEYISGSFDIVKPQQLDFYIPSKNIAIEFNGIWWHSELAGRGKRYHWDKFKKCLDKNIRLIQIWEHELIKNENLIKSRLYNALGVIPNKVFARKLKIVDVDSKIAQDFYNKNHIQGALSSKINIGLSDGIDLLSVMSFSKSRFSKRIAEWELTRFASRLNTNVVGGASKLFKHFIVKHNPQNIVSYADLKWGVGNVYKTLDFEFLHYSQPNYWYFKTMETIHHRVKFQKHKLPTELHHVGSEWDIMKHLGWNRYWDCGNSVWLWKSN